METLTNSVSSGNPLNPKPLKVVAPQRLQDCHTVEQLELYLAKLKQKVEVIQHKLTIEEANQYSVILGMLLNSFIANFRKRKTI